MPGKQQDNRSGMPASPRVRCDLIGLSGFRAVVRSAALPVLLQLVALATFIALILNGLGLGPGMDEGVLLTFRKTNLTMLIVWELWWPGMIAVALAFGRAWCTVCPMELVNRIGAGAGSHHCLEALALCETDPGGSGARGEGRSGRSGGAVHLGADRPELSRHVCDPQDGGWAEQAVQKRRRTRNERSSARRGARNPAVVL